MEKYTEEEIADIKDREGKALSYLKELHLSPAVLMQAINLGNDSFGMKPIPYLQDTKYDKSNPTV